MWLEVERSTVTHEITSVKPCHPDLQKLVESKK
jgi:sarcosine oxidase delta subunit